MCRGRPWNNSGMTRAAYNGQWQRVRVDVLERDGWRCQLCGKPIDRNARPRSPMSASVDHIVELQHGGDWWDPANLRASHLVCNQRRNGKPERPRYPTPRSW